MALTVGGADPFVLLDAPALPVGTANRRLGSEEEAAVLPLESVSIMPTADFALPFTAM
ncbi:hypothetical protein GCM10022421_03440 [Oceanisphaera sediminis]|uniref:Uncharacterized protein n=1 Tax=Oceanisphaera sediminis TaxID=981381 RepID=A0ABP7D7C6_9GAMM